MEGASSKLKKRDLIIAIVVFAVLAVAGVAYILNKSTSKVNLSLIDSNVNSTTMSMLYSLANNVTLANRIGIGAVGSSIVNITGKSSLLNSSGKPEVLYIGAEYCPYCAVTRWGLIMALMRFGNFTGLKYMASDPSDIYPNTPTFTFLNATYSSSYISFVSLETLNRTGKMVLQIGNASENGTYKHYDSGEGIPFIDFGNTSLNLGAPVLPSVISNLDWAQVLSGIKNNNTQVSQSLIGIANVFTAQICKMNNFEPASVCDQPYVKEVLRAESA